MRLKKRHLWSPILGLALLFILPLGQAATDCAVVTEIPTVECEALVALYDSTDGENWSRNTGWNVTNTPCSWEGIACDGGHVTILDLWSNGLSGLIPSELGNLSNLNFLNLYSNGLSGSIPAELGNLSNLSRLYLNNNQLSGSIPAELGNLSNLSTLFLDNNELSGSIPTELGNLSNLEFLDLSSNGLSGSIPSELGNLSQLHWLYLENNQISGSIPAELGNLSNLERLDLSSNQINASIPTELGNLSNLSYLLLTNNELCGNIPVSLMNLNLNPSGYFWGPDLLSHNHLTASSPALIAWLDEHDPDWATTQTGCLGFFTTLTVKVAENVGTVTLTVRRGGDTNATLEVDYATTDGTALEGTDYVGLTGRLTWLDGDSSNKTLTITLIDNTVSEYEKTFTVTLSEPTSGADLETATIIIKDDEPTDCAIVTEIPEVECEALIALYDSTDGENWTNNTGWNVTNTPCSWRGITCDGGHVTILDFFVGNRLSGSIPSELGNLSNLEILSLWGNGLSGSIPTELGNLSNLSQLYLSNNQLSGSIPAELGNLSNLSSLRLDNNQLTFIPAELGNLSNLSSLYLDNNQLSGSIPAELGNLSNLSSLRLDNNQLCGIIPTSFLNLNMSELDLGDNHLTASSPTLIAWLDEHDPDWATTQTPCPGFGFTTLTVEVAENAGTVTLTIRRGGDTNGTLEVDYATTDGTALEGTDYVGATGRLTWLDGDSSDKTLTVTITDDSLSEGNETFTVTLSDPSSGGSLDSATVTISDNDTTLVTLVGFTATALETGILLEWQTATELDNAGFHLWRATGEGWKSGDYSTVIRLTEQLLPAQGNFSLYSYIDANVSTYTTYYYGLEDIDLYGQSTYHWDFIKSATTK